MEIKSSLRRLSAAIVHWLRIYQSLQANWKVKMKKEFLKKGQQLIGWIATHLSGMNTIRIAFSCTCQPNMNDVQPQMATARIKSSVVFDLNGWFFKGKLLNCRWFWLRPATQLPIISFREQFHNTRSHRYGGQCERCYRCDWGQYDVLILLHQSASVRWSPISRHFQCNRRKFIGRIVQCPEIGSPIGMA